MARSETRIDGEVEIQNRWRGRNPESMTRLRPVGEAKRPVGEAKRPVGEAKRPAGEAGYQARYHTRVHHPVLDHVPHPPCPGTMPGVPTGGVPLTVLLRVARLLRSVHQATFLKEAKEPTTIKEHGPFMVPVPGVKTSISGKIHS